MMPEKIFVFTAGDRSARAHLDDSIHSPISLESIGAHFDQVELEKLQSLSDEQGLYAWGAVSGRSNKRNWESMNPGDWVLCGFESTYRFSARVMLKAHNPSAAREVWGEMEPGKTWEYMYFLSTPVAIKVPQVDLDSYLNKRYMGFTKISDERVSKIVNTFGSIERFFERFLSPPASSSDGFEALMLDYSRLGVVFKSPVRGAHYFVSDVTQDRCVIERVDATESLVMLIGTPRSNVPESGGPVPLSD